MNIRQAQLPKGWEMKTLGEVVDVLDNLRKPITKRDRIEGDYPYYGATGILSYVHDYIFSEKLVLIGEDGAKWQSGDNTSFIAEGKYWVNNHAHVIRPNRKIILDEWIVYFLNFSDLTPFITGMTVPKLNQEKMRNIPIPLPPLPEQRHIVSVLEECFAAIAKAKANAGQNLKNAKELFESYLFRVFDPSTRSGHGKKGDGWVEKKLGNNDLLEIIDGDRGKNYPTQKDFLDEGFCLFMNTKNVRPDGFEFQTTMFISEAKDKAMGKGKLKRNDVVMTTRGTIGNLGVYDENVEFDEIRINSGMLIFRPNTKVITPHYLFEVFRSGIFKAQIKKHTTGAAQPQLPIKTLINFTIPVPKNIEEQQTIVRQLDALRAETQKLEAVYKKKIADLEELKKSILQKAFAGELRGGELVEPTTEKELII
jgi:type I restriction enzyme, S subunit